MRYIVYSIFNDKNEIIYIGCSGNLINRINCHLYSKEWSDEICKITLKKFENKEDALTEEALLIVKVKPKYNIVHNYENRKIYTKRNEDYMANKEIRTIDRVSDYFGSAYKAAQELNVPNQQYYTWMKNGYIPYRRGKQVEELTEGAVKASEIWEDAGKAAILNRVDYD